MKQTIFFVAAVLCSTALQAQDDSISLDNVTVTAAKTPIKQNQTGKVVTVIDQATLERNIDKSLTEILNTQAAIFTAGANNTPGSNQELYFRGSPTGNVLILIDGIPAYDPSQNSSAPIDINNINVSQIQRIEILKGSQSTLWGSNAMAGVINIITKKGGVKKIAPSANLAYGSFNTFKGNIGMGGTINRFDYNLSYNRVNTDGISAAYDSTQSSQFDKDGFKQDNVQANLGYRITDNFSLGYTGLYSKYRADADFGAFTDDKDYYISSANDLNALRFNYKNTKTDITLVQSIVRSDRQYKNDSTDVPGWSFGKYKGTSYITDLYGKYQFVPQLSLLLGAQYIGRNMSQEYRSISSYGPYEALPLGKDTTKMNNISFYGSLLLVDLKGFNNELGLRFNKNSQYGTNTTFTFNPSYNIGDRTKVFVNISSGFREPSLYQLYSEYRNPTTKLKPEKSLNYEIGVHTNFNDPKDWFRVVGFKRDIKDLIIYYTDATTFQSFYMNQDEQHDYGFEMESNISIGAIGSFTNNLSYVEGQGKSNAVYVNNLYRRPNFTFNSSLVLYPVKKLTINPSFRFVGNRIKGEYDAGPATLPHYYTIDCYASYSIIPAIKIYLDFRNITNQKYFDTPGYTTKQFNFMSGISVSL